MVNERVPTQFLLQGTYRAPVVHNTIILSVYFSLPDNYLSHTKTKNQITSPPHTKIVLHTQIISSLFHFSHSHTYLSDTKTSHPIPSNPKSNHLAATQKYFTPHPSQNIIILSVYFSLSGNYVSHTKTSLHQLQHPKRHSHCSRQ